MTKAKVNIPQKDKITQIESNDKKAFFRKRYSRVVCPNEAAIEDNSPAKDDYPQCSLADHVAPNHEDEEQVNELVEVGGVEDLGEICGMVVAMEPKTMQKAVQIFGALTDEAVMNGSIKKVKKRGNVGEHSKDKNGRDDNKRTRTGNAFSTTATPQ
ncbi:hypothetical protein Tco_1553821 [Tanacetum coccineum]